MDITHLAIALMKNRLHDAFGSDLSPYQVIGEPTDLPSARALALTEASSQGIPTWIFLGPLIPFVNDDETSLTSIFLLAQKTRSHIIHDKLNLKHDTLQNLTPVLNTLGLEPQKLKEQLDPHSDFCKNLTSTIEKLGSAYEVRAEPAFDKPLKARQLTLL